MKRLLSVILALALAAAFCSAALAEAADENVWYVFTENGKPLNVRATPGGEIVGSLPTGEQVLVEGFINNAWALITYEGAPAYINRRFLIRQQVNLTDEEIQRAIAPTEDTLEALNEEYRSAKTVASYRITLRPARVTSWVNMYWGPSESTEIIMTYRANAQLVVLKELTAWLQVQDPDTGDVGFVKRIFAVQ